jgi:YjbE family integral membrane protein
MDGAVAASSLGVLLQILLIDLLLSGDNAMVIALACRRLPPAQARKAAYLGAGGAILFRLVLTLMAGALMRLPFLQLLSALPLLVIALNLMIDEGADEDALLDEKAAQDSMIAAASVIVISDAAMSLDNVVALAAVSGGSFWLLAFGLVCTVPLIIFGSFGFSALMKAFPLLVDAGAAMLGWVAGGMMVNDPVIAEWVRIQAPALSVAVPLACAIFVLVQGRFARQRARTARASDSVPLLQPETARQVAVARVAPQPPPKPAAPPAPTPAALQAAIASVTPVSVVAEDAAPSDSGDRWMMVGLAALFVIFGVFLTVFVMIPD